ncbi:hypothetical protein GQ457_05G020820 [Hibiscus cannabinus]
MPRNKGNRLGGPNEELEASGRRKPTFGVARSLVFCNSGVEYRYPIRGIDTQIQHWNLGIGTPCITPGIDTC